MPPHPNFDDNAFNALEAYLKAMMVIQRSSLNPEAGEVARSDSFGGIQGSDFEDQALTESG
jgi:hypothetical protein